LLGAFVATALVAPAVGAPDAGRRLVPAEQSASSRSISTFTPASADPRLAALLARSGLKGSDFRFTPSDTRRGSRAVTVAVRARSSVATRQDARVGLLDSASGPSVGLVPVAFDLGASVGWKRFALSGEVIRLDLASLPGSRESVDVGVSYVGKRASARLKAIADRPIGNLPRLVADDPSVAIDVAGSYSIARNIDLTAGVRYKRENNRLERLTDNRRDSQAVYVGTAFRF